MSISGVAYVTSGIILQLHGIRIMYALLHTRFSVHLMNMLVFYIQRSQTQERLYILKICADVVALAQQLNIVYHSKGLSIDRYIVLNHTRSRSAGMMEEVILPAIKIRGKKNIWAAQSGMITCNIKPNQWFYPASYATRKVWI